MSRRHLYILTAILSVIGLSLFAYKYLVLDFPLRANEQAQRWDVEARVRFVAGKGAIKAGLGLPFTTDRFLVVDEQFVSRGFGLITKKTGAGGRRAIWSHRKNKGEHVLYYRATLQALQGSPKPPAKLKTPAIEPTTLKGPELAAAQAVLAGHREQSADNESLVVLLLKHLNEAATDPNIKLLLGAKSDTLKRALIAESLLRLHGLPARVVSGIRLQRSVTKLSPQPWLQVFYAGGWQSFNPATSETGLPDDFLVVNVGDIQPLAVIGARVSTLEWSVRKNEEEALSAALVRGKMLSRQMIDFSLFSLPLETQQVYRVLLLIPLGAFLLVLLRNVVGIKTFGTFMPILIALAFRETQLIWGVILFVALVGIGLSIRFYLEHLKLLLVPRLAALLIIVVLLMAFISVISHKLDIERGLSVALFPMVIISMTIERMSIVWDERGAAEAFQQGLGSLMVAILSYLVMFNRFTEHLVFVFPELLLVVLAATLLLGRYSGYRLLELGRFKVLAGEKK